MTPRYPGARVTLRQAAPTPDIVRMVLWAAGKGGVPLPEREAFRRDAAGLPPGEALELARGLITVDISRRA